MRKTLWTCLFLCAGLPALVSAGTKSSTNPNISEMTLANGMKLIVKQDHRAPVVVSQVWYKVGSSYEYGGITGVSHVLEHMMFKGTQKHAAGEFSRIIAENGGRENAFTGRDYTAYFQQLESSRLAISFELEADRMRNLTLPNEEFTKELPVVMEERRMRTEDKPQSLTYEQFLATAYASSSYQIPVIGWMNDLENMKIDDLKSWYKKWYTPNNATLVVVGDVKPDAVFELAQKHFGQLKTNPVPLVKPQVDAPQYGEKRITVKVPAKLPYYIAGYKVPSLRTAKEPTDAYALEVMAGILSGGNSARLKKELVRNQQVAAEADSGYDLYARQSSLFLFDAVPAQGKTITDIEAAIQLQIDKLKTELVTERELKRIKAQVVASKVYEQDSVFYQAMTLGQLETVGMPWQTAEDYVNKIKSVTAEQVREVAKKYLVDTQKTVAILEPQAATAAPRKHLNIAPGSLRH